MAETEAAAGETSGAQTPEHQNQSPKEQKPVKVECCVFEDAPTPCCDINYIGEEDIAAWLGGEPTASEDGKPLAAGLRLVFVRWRRVHAHPLDDVTFREVHDALGVPQDHSSYARQVMAGCGRYSVSTTQSVLVSYLIVSLLDSSIVIKSDSNSNITTGYVLYGGSTSPDKILSRIKDEFPSNPHPFLVPMILWENSASKIANSIASQFFAVSELERETGFGYNHIRNNQADAGESSKAVDIADRIKALGKSTGVVIATIFNLQALSQKVGFVLKELQDDGSLAMRQRAEFLKSALEEKLTECSMIEKRLQAQQTVIYNMIAQQDSKANISIASDSKALAEASKRDSSAMKIIAILTTMFLPGTFISALFAMPILNWDVPSVSEVAGNHFWFYWAVSVPLTGVVMAVLGAYAWYQGRKNRIKVQKARESTDEKVKIV
ncbi:hypothetical protein QBC44DRAFT_358303 [Cladorrhinum sp. PSN332]|nr:hypothetical protein QBC44DRAFT_358303 [Cladorrhinum sp. PSN332]